ncbi:MAG: ribosome biogenesis protein [Thaumarchaeota archaeon]|nr:ribosome biogenesis protein [Nitrososphaerota archaeon]
MRVDVLMRYQDDPRKCTAARLLKAGIARKIRGVPRGRRAIILNPYSDTILMPSDGRTAGAVVGVDCSWRLAGGEFGAPRDAEGGRKRGRGGGAARQYDAGSSRRLPPLLAGNPVNYAKVGMLTTAEAIAASLFIMGYDDMAHNVLGRFRWGHTFYDLNRNILAEYAAMTEQDDASEIAAGYGLA